MNDWDNSRVYHPSDLVEAVLARMEQEGVPEEVCDEVRGIIERWEYTNEPNEDEPKPEDYDAY